MSDWEFTFEAPAGQRILGSWFIGIEAGWADKSVPDGDMMWWDCNHRRWIKDSEFPWGKNNPERDFSSSSCAPCRSFKAFKRHMRRHGDSFTVDRVRLASRFVGNDIYATRK